MITFLENIEMSGFLEMIMLPVLALSAGVQTASAPPEIVSIKQLQSGYYRVLYSNGNTQLTDRIPLRSVKDIERLESEKAKKNGN